MPPDIRDEFYAAAVYLFVAEVDIRAPISTKIRCTDATPLKEAACQAGVSRELSETLYERSETKVFRTRLDWSSADLLEARRTMRELPVSVGAALAVVPWELSCAGDFKEQAHVNLQEALAVKEALKLVAENNLTPLRVVSCSDSCVVIEASAKGRSSSIHLNGILRSCLDWHVLSDVYFQLIYVPTKLNASDDPTRNVPLRQPVIDPTCNGLNLPERTFN